MVPMIDSSKPGVCPSCQTSVVAAGTRYNCESCKGVLVRTAELQEMLISMAPDDARPLEARLSPAGGAAQTRPCPLCETKMVLNKLAGVTIDICATHGVWFDTHELAVVLEHGGEDYADREWVRGEAPRFVAGAATGGVAGLVDVVVWRGLLRWLVSPKKPDGV
jgi:Zn-finger nucleic acid-binding protein